MTDLYYLSQADGVGEWRMKEAKDLSDLVQNRITYLQVSTGLPAARPAVRALPPPPCTHVNIHACSRPFSGHRSHLLVSFAPPHSCQCQFPPGAGGSFDSRLFQRSGLTSSNLVACQRFSETRTCAKTRGHAQRTRPPEPGRTDGHVCPERSVEGFLPTPHRGRGPTPPGRGPQC